MSGEDSWIGRRRGNGHRAGESGNHAKERSRFYERMLWGVIAFLGVTLVGGVVSVAGYLLAEDREHIKCDAEMALDGVAALNTEMGVVKNDLDHLAVGVETLRTEMKEGQQMILETLYTLPSQRRGTAPQIHDEEAP